MQNCGNFSTDKWQVVSNN